MVRAGSWAIFLTSFESRALWGGAKYSGFCRKIGGLDTRTLKIYQIYDYYAVIEFGYLAVYRVCFKTARLQGMLAVLGPSIIFLYSPFKVPQFIRKDVHKNRKPSGPSAHRRG